VSLAGHTDRDARAMLYALSAMDVASAVRFIKSYMSNNTIACKIHCAIVKFVVDLLVRPPSGMAAEYRSIVMSVSVWLACACLFV